VNQKNISENTGISQIPQISSNGDNVYVVWQDDTPDNPDIFSSRSIDGGLTFSEPKNISENTGDSFLPQISSDGDNVYVVWQDTTPGINFDIFSSRSIDGGLTFSEPENLSENTEGSFAPQISSDGDNVYVVWYDTAPGSPDIFFARSTDGGLTFSDPKNISENTGGSQIPQISSNGNNVYVVWEDTTTTDGNSDIFFARSTDGGLTFSDPKNISENTGNSVLPQISIEGDNVYVVWHDDTPGNFDIFFARSTNGGFTFSEPENLS
jgi:glutaredoxin